jgi:hypothetical protein
MKIITRTTAALALVAGMVATSGPPAGAGPTPAPADVISVDVVVVGDAPPSASVNVVFSGGLGGPVHNNTVTLADAATDPDIPDFEVASNNIGWAVYIDPESDGGADSISYACDQEVPLCQASLAPSGNTPVVHAYFINDFANEVADRVDITITLTFDPPPLLCDGQVVTVDLNQPFTSPTSEPDVVLGTPAGETINGFGGADRICGGGGRDTLRGGGGRDRLLGGVGPDRLEGGTEGDTLLGGQGVDTLLGQAGADALNGGTQRDTCNGGPQRDTASLCEVRTSIP